VAKEREVAFAITASDQASKVFKEVEDAVGSGTKNIRDALNDATGASSKFEQGQERLRGWARENIREQRLYRSVINEARDAIGAAGIGLAAFGISAGAADGATKRLSESLNQGYAAFQGIDAIVGLISPLAGPWGLAIAAIGGIAAGMFKLFQETPKATEKIKEQKTAVEELLSRHEKWAAKLQGTADANRGVSEEEANLLRARLDIVNQVIAAQESGAKKLDIVVDTAKRSSAELAAMDDEIFQASTRTIEQNRAAAAEYQQQQVAVRAAIMETRAVIMAPGLFEDLVQKITLVERSAVQMAAQIDRTVAQAWDRASKAGVKAMKTQVDTVASATASLKADMEKVHASTTQIFGQITAVIGQSFEDLFTGTEAAGRKFMKRIVLMVIDVVQAKILAALADIWVNSIFSLGMSLPGDFAKMAAATVALQAARAFVSSVFHQGGVVPKPGGGAFMNAPPSQEFPILVRGGETVRTEAQEKALQSGAGATVIVNINAPVDRVEWVKQAVEDGLRAAGVTSIDRFIRNENYDLALVGAQ
jgi:hypothetical protein